jgi:hypothetical protein
LSVAKLVQLEVAKAALSLFGHGSSTSFVVIFCFQDDRAALDLRLECQRFKFSSTSWSDPWLDPVSQSQVGLFVGNEACFDHPTDSSKSVGTTF